MMPNLDMITANIRRNKLIIRFVYRRKTFSKKNHTVGFKPTDGDTKTTWIQGGHGRAMLL